MTAGPVRVLSYPPAHGYVDRLHPEVARLVHRDEPWPRLRNLYDPAWVHANRGGWDVVHFHFTWEQYPVVRLAQVLQAHRDSGAPVVWTAHDLRNPHTLRPGEDEPYLAHLAGSSQRAITLTAGAAQELERRFGVAATVIPHGPVVPPAQAKRWRERRPPSRPGRSRRRVLLHAKMVRANLDVRTPVTVVGELAGRGVPIDLDVLVHREHAHRIPSGVAGVRVRAHEWLSLDELCAELVAADALLLPYRWGTHSGLLELATDLGVPVIAGDTGYLAEQTPVVSVPLRDRRLRRAELTDALLALVEGGAEAMPETVTLARRGRALRGFRAAHSSLYAELGAR